MPATRRHPMLRWGWLTLLILAASADAMPVVPETRDTVTVASLRLPGEDQGWPDRRDQVLALLQTLQPDVIAVQQVLQTPDRLNPACWLAKRLRYSCDFVTADPPSHPSRRGNAMLTRLPVLEDGVTLLHPPDEFSAAGMLRLQLGQDAINVYFARLPGDDAPARRRHQAGDLMAWIAATADGLPSLIAGDFAAGTAELALQAPGFRPALAPRDTRAAPRAHGQDVLYQHDRFADATLQPVQLPDDDGNTPLRLGVLVSLRLLAATALTSAP